jgi:putative membrane protein
MPSFLLTTLTATLSLLVVDIIFPGIEIANFPTAIISALVLGMVNGSIKPILSLLSLPINLLTLGLFSVVINGICFWLVGALVPGFTVDGIVAVLVGPILLSLSTTLLNSYFLKQGVPTLPFITTRTLKDS